MKQAHPDKLDSAVLLQKPRPILADLTQLLRPEERYMPLRHPMLHSKPPLAQLNLLKIRLWGLTSASQGARALKSKVALHFSRGAETESRDRPQVTEALEHCVLSIQVGLRQTPLANAQELWILLMAGSPQKLVSLRHFKLKLLMEKTKQKS